MRARLLPVVFPGIQRTGCGEDLNEVGLDLRTTTELSAQEAEVTRQAVLDLHHVIA